MVTTLCFQGILALDAHPFNHPEPRWSETSEPFSSTPHGSQTGAGSRRARPRPVHDWRDGMRNIGRFGSGSPFAPDAMIQPLDLRGVRAALGRRASGGIPNVLDCRHHGVATRRSAASAGDASIDRGKYRLLRIGSGQLAGPHLTRDS